MKVFDIFSEISQIPRESGNEEGIRQYLLEFARKNKLGSARDEGGNIFLYAQADKGYENYESICLQAHMDMVCVKTPESNHNFLTDPIKLVREGDTLRAEDTSLGADNGIGMAIMLALMTDKTYKHGPLEGVITYSEETGMNGAFSIQSEYVKSKYLINLDSEEDGIIYIGCAGGADIIAERQFTHEKTEPGWDAVRLKIGGLLGGHSGAEIHLQRLNAISVLARLLYTQVNAGLAFRLVSLNGGTRRNVIPSEAEALVLFPSLGKKQSVELMISEFERIKAESSVCDPGLAFSHVCSHCDQNVCIPSEALSEKDSVALVSTLLAVPHGVFKYSMTVNGVVETSDNLAVVNTEEGLCKVEVSVRSLIDSARHYLCSIIECGLSGRGFGVTVSGEYPAWTPDTKSILAKKISELWEKKTGVKPIITSMHAGFECGILNSRLHLKDSISIGPELKDVHSVNEHLSISSTERLYDFLKEFLCLGL